MNALQSALSSFGRLGSSIASQARNVWQRAEPQFRRVVARVSPPVPPRNIQPRLSLAQISQPARQAVKNITLDLPFYQARLQKEVGKRMSPHTPYGPPIMPSPFKIGGKEVRPNFITPSKTSAEFQPFIDYPPPTPELAALKKKVIQTAGFRPVAKKYFQSVPVVPMPPGVEGGFPAFAMTSPTNPAVVMRQPSGEYYNPYQTMLHELLHTAPRPFLPGSNPYEDYLRAYNQTGSLRGTMISYGGPQWRIEGTSLPFGFPGAEEGFATVGETLGRSAPYAPTIGKYYEGIFQPGVSPIKKRQFTPSFPTMLEEQWRLEEERKKKK